MKKKLFTLLLCAFAVMGTKAALPVGLEANVSDDGTLTISSATPGLLKTAIEDESNADYIAQIKAANPTKIVLIGEFNNDDFNKARDAKVGVGSVTEIDCSRADFNGSTYTFEHWKTTLTKVSLPTGTNDTVVPGGAFQNCSLVTDVVFPANIKEIAAQAFSKCGITKVVIPSTLEVVRSGAFTNCTSIREVIVPITWKKEGDDTVYPVCELNAFDFNTLVSQTVVGEGAALRAKLVFDEDYFDYYCGDWKRGLAFTQENLNAIKDGYYTDGTYDPETGQNTGGTKLGPNNGWQQFAMTGSPSEQVVPKGEFVRTWSSGTAYAIPVYTYWDSSKSTYVAGDIFRCYRVTGYEYKENDSSVSLTKLEEVMPAETGMILRSTALNEYDALVFMVEAVGDKYAGKLTQYPHGSDNYLAPTMNGGDKIGPVDYESDGKTVAYRNFGLYSAGEGKYQFVRFAKGTLPANRAYLKLTATQFPNNNESATQGPGSGLDNADASGAKISLIFLDDEEENGEVTGINTVNLKKLQDNVYYNLQGMKVENPSKGIYIYNGKKVIK